MCYSGCTCRQPLPCMQAGIQDATGFIMFPLVVHSLDLVVSAVGIMSVGSVGRQREDPYAVMKVRPQKPRSRPDALPWWATPAAAATLWADLRHAAQPVEAGPACRALFCLCIEGEVQVLTSEHEGWSCCVQTLTLSASQVLPANR